MIFYFLSFSMRRGRNTLRSTWHVVDISLGHRLYFLEKLQFEPLLTATSLHVNGHLSTMANFFCPGRQKIHTLTLIPKPLYDGHLLQRPLAFVPEMDIVERFNCIRFVKPVHLSNSELAVLSGHLAIPQGWLLNAGLVSLYTVHCVIELGKSVSYVQLIHEVMWQ